MGNHRDRNWIDACDEAFNEAMEAEAEAGRKPKGRRGIFRGKAPRTRNVMLATGLLVVGIAPFGIAATGSNLREGVRNGTTTKETEIVGNLAGTSALKGGYVTRQSNLSSSGGGAVYGCRSTAGGSAAKPPKNPCLRGNNLSNGYAFEFNASNGSTVGVFTAGTGGDSKKPFITNATGVATGLNADRVDGLDAKQIADATAAVSAADATNKANAAKDRWVTIGADGNILRQSGGFKTVNCYQANANCYIDAGSDVTNNAVTSSIVTANNPDAGIDVQLTGDTSAAACFDTFVNCGPAGTDTGNGGNAGVFVVTPRDSDGTDPGAGDRYTFTAIISAAEAG